MGALADWGQNTLVRQVRSLLYPAHVCRISPSRGICNGPTTSVSTGLGLLRHSSQEVGRAGCITTGYLIPGGNVLHGHTLWLVFSLPLPLDRELG